MKNYGILMASVCAISLCADKNAQQKMPPRHGEALYDTMQGSYNLPAAIAPSHKMDGQWVEDWAFTVDAAYTYWYISQEGMRIATDGVLNGAALNRASVQTGYFPDFQYNNGFKVGIGFAYNDEWQYNANYMWAHTNVNTSTVVTPAGTAIPANTTSPIGTSVFMPDDWFFGITPFTSSPSITSPSSAPLAATAMSANWDLTLQVVDIVGGRPFYQGRTLTVAPQAGLELVFINQSLNATLTEAGGQVTVGYPGQPLTSVTTANSWGIGTTAGCKAHQLLGRGFYAEGAGQFGLIYTTYTNLSHTESAALVTYEPGSYQISYNNYRAMRPNAMMELGLGWAMYFGGNQGNACYFDISASYEFSVYWAQNMLRKLMDDFIRNNGYNSSPAAPDLYTQGLTITASIVF